MMINKIKLLTEKFEPTNHNSVKVPKDFETTNKSYKSLGTSVIYSPISELILIKCSLILMDGLILVLLLLLEYYTKLVQKKHQILLNNKCI